MTSVNLVALPPVVVTDASVWVARLTPQEPRHEACVRWWKNFDASSGRVVVPVLLLAEVGGAISRRTGKPALAKRVVQSLLDAQEMTFVPMDRELGEHAASMAAQLGLRGADAVYVALAHRLNLPLLSLDDEHVTKAGRTVQVLQL